MTAMKRRTQCLFLVVLVLAIFYLPQKVVAAPYYEGKVIKIVVALLPGGGYDRIARIFAKHLPKYIPGKPTIIVENMPGASSMVGANYIYNVAKPDGLTIGSVNRAYSFCPVIKNRGGQV